MALSIALEDTMQQCDTNSKLISMYVPVTAAQHRCDDAIHDSNDYSVQNLLSQKQRLDTHRLGRQTIYSTK